MRWHNNFCSYLVGNYQETLNDATAAVTLEPTFIKAMERGKFLTNIFVAWISRKPQTISWQGFEWSSQLLATGRRILLLVSLSFLNFSSYSSILDPYVRQSSRGQYGFLSSLCSFPGRSNNIALRQTLLFLFLGARACMKLKRYEEAKTWCDKGLAVSFVTWCHIHLPS